MYAAQYRRKRILEELYKNQAETINLLHKTKHGKPVDESYRNIKAAEIREIIRDKGWDKESKPKEKKRKEAKTVSKGSHKGQKKKITHETSPATSDSESEGTERASTSQKKPKKKRTHETSYDTSDSESEGAERVSTLLVYFRDSGKWNFDGRDPWFAVFSVREPCERPPLYDPQKIPDIKISHPNKYKKTDLYTMYCLLYQHFSGAHALLKIFE